MKTSLKIGLGIGALIMALPSIAFANSHNFDEEIRSASKNYGVPFVILKGIIATESSFNPEARASTTSATGLMQMTKGATSDMGYQWADMIYPLQNVNAGAKYLKKQIDRFGLVGGIRAYYAGAGNYRSGKLEAESLAYVTKVLAYSAAFVLDTGTWI